MPTTAPACVVDADSPAVRLKSLGRTARRHRRLLRAVGRTRDAEVHDRRHVVGADHDVGGLEVTMHDAGFVRRDQAGDDAARDVQGARDGQLFVLVQDGRDPTLDERHRDV